MIDVLVLNGPPILLAAGRFNWPAAVIAGIVAAAVVVVVAAPLVLTGGVAIWAGCAMAVALGGAAGAAAGFWFQDPNGPGSGEHGTDTVPNGEPEPGPAHPPTKLEISFPPSTEAPDQARPFACRIAVTRGDGTPPTSEEITAASAPALREEFKRKLDEILPPNSTLDPGLKVLIYKQPFPGKPIINDLEQLIKTRDLKVDLFDSPPPL